MMIFENPGKMTVIGQGDDGFLEFLQDKSMMTFGASSTKDITASPRADE